MYWQRMPTFHDNRQISLQPLNVVNILCNTGATSRDAK